MSGGDGANRPDAPSDGVPLDVPTGEGGMLRLFAIDTGSAEGAALKSALAAEDAGDGDAAAAALGVADLDPWWVTLVVPADLGAPGLGSLLGEGYGIEPDALSAAAPAIARAERAGALLAVQSPAFSGRATRIAPAAHLRPLAAFDTQGRPAPALPMARAEAGPVGRDAPPPKSPRRPRRAMSPAVILALLALAALLVAVAAFAGGADGG